MILHNVSTVNMRGKEWKHRRKFQREKHSGARDVGGYGLVN